jgi:hypothetical protein
MLSTWPAFNVDCQCFLLQDPPIFGMAGEVWKSR